MVLSWRDHAACNGMDPALFFPQVGHDARAAKAVCASCEVREDCLMAAIQAGEAHGVFGGMTEKERRRVGRQLRRRPIAVCGTEPGYYRHLRTTRTDPCAECRAAHAKAERDRKPQAAA